MEAQKELTDFEQLIEKGAQDLYFYNADLLEQDRLALEELITPITVIWKLFSNSPLLIEKLN